MNSQHAGALSAFRRPLPRHPTSTDSVSLVESAYIIFTLLYIVGAFYLVGNSSGAEASVYEDRSTGSSTTQVISAGIYGISVLLMSLRLNRVPPLLMKSLPLLLLLAFTLVSALWSVDPGTSARRSIALLLTMCFAIYLATRLTPVQFLYHLAITCTIVLMLSILAVGIPGIGVHAGGRYAGAMRGIIANKNDFGEFCAIAALCYLTLGVRRWFKLEGLIFFGLFLMACGALWFSNARTPLLAMVAAAGSVGTAAYLFSPRLRLSIGLAALAAAMLLIVPAIIGWAFSDELLELIGRNATLTGRLKLWEYAISIGVNRPWLGFGFKSFWTDAVTFDLVVLHQYWTGAQGGIQMTGNGHNGFLDVWLELGMVGFALFVGMLVSYARRCIVALTEGDDGAVLWNIAILPFMMVYSVTESVLMTHSEIGWFCLAFGYLQLSRMYPPRPLVTVKL